MQRKTHDILHTARIATCFTGWEEMEESVDVRVRTCPDCKANAYKLTEVPEPEIAGLIEAIEKAAWPELQLARRFDGTFSRMSAECYPLVHSKWCSAKLTSGLTLGMFALLAVLALLGTMYRLDYLRTVAVFLFGMAATTAAFCLPAIVISGYYLHVSAHSLPRRWHACHRLVLPLILATVLLGFWFELPTGSAVPGWAWMGSAILIYAVEVFGSIFVQNVYKKDERRFFRSLMIFNLMMATVIVLWFAVNYIQGM